MRRKLLDILELRPVQTLVFFVLLTATSHFVPVPWWEGTALTIHPELPEPSGAFVSAPEERETVKQELAKVDLDSAAEVTATASAPRHSISPDPCSKDAEDRPDSCLSFVRHRGTRHTESRRVALPSLQDLKLHETIRTLDDKLDEPPTELDRPCLEWYSSAMTSGYRPLCKRRTLDPFFEQLRLVALDEARRPARISQLGDSLVAGDAFTGELRRLLQDQFGDGGFGFVHAGEASPHIGSRNLTTDTSPGWEVHDVVWEPHSEFKFGIAGVSFLPEGSPSLGIYPQDSGHGRTFDRVGVLYYRRRPSSSIHLTVDGTQQTLDLSGPPKTNAVKWRDVEPGAQDVRFAGFDRSTYVYGVLLENSGSGVVVDNLGLSSGRAPRLRFVDDDQWRAQIRKRNPDVMSFAFGVNSAGKHKAADEWLEEYRTQYTDVLEVARSASDRTGCMVVSLLTRGEREDGQIKIYDSVRPLVRYQRDAARRARCAFWNAFEAMGGAEGARRWFDNYPQLLGSDLAHPTRAGYKKLANLFYASIIDEFRRYLDERIRRSTVPQRRNDDASGDSTNAPQPLPELPRSGE